MKRTDTIKLRIEPDGTAVRVLPDGSTQPYEIAAPDHARLDSMSDKERFDAALDDTENPPLGDEALARMRRALPAPDLKSLRGKLDLTQEGFAREFAIPVGNIRDWEQGRSRPDAATTAYLQVIEHDPGAVRRALHRAAHASEGSRASAKPKPPKRR